MMPFNLFLRYLPPVLLLDMSAHVELVFNMAFEKPNAKGVQVFAFQNIHSCFSSDCDGAEKL